MFPPNPLSWPFPRCLPVCPLGPSQRCATPPFSFLRTPPSSRRPDPYRARPATPLYLDVQRIYKHHSVTLLHINKNRSSFARTELTASAERTFPLPEYRSPINCKLSGASGAAQTAVHSKRKIASPLYESVNATRTRPGNSFFHRLWLSWVNTVFEGDSVMKKIEQNDDG